LNLETAEILKDSRLLPLLYELEKRWGDFDDDEECLKKQLYDAINACNQE
jgi:hypothetical protein